MDRTNYIGEMLINEKDYLNEINLGTSKFFNNENCEILFHNNKRTIKAYRDDENSVIYILDKKDEKIHVHYENIYDFQKDKTTTEILRWNNEKTDLKELYFSKVIECRYDKSFDLEDLNNLTEEGFRNKFKNIKDKSKIDSLLTDLKKMFGNNFFQNKDLLTGLLSKPVDCTVDIGVLAKYNTFLFNQQYVSQIYDDNFYKKLNNSLCKKYNTFLNDWGIKIKQLNDACIKNNYISDDKAYVFNDLDNNVFTRNGKLVLTDQNCGFYIDFKDENNYQVFFMHKEYSDVENHLDNFDKKLNNNNIKNLEDVAFKVENGEIIYAKSSVIMYIFDLDLSCSEKAMNEDGLLEQKYPEDINSYEYQKNYFCNTFNLTEFQFIAQAMTTLGGGFYYNPKSGSFTGEVKYIKNLPKIVTDKEQKINNFTYLYLYLDKYNFLNDDWLNASKYFLEILKRDRPTPGVYDQKFKNPQDAIDEAINFYENLIKKNESNRKNINKMKN